MPTPDDIRKQIEVVLRTRFFSMVPEVGERTEAEHDQHRLSRSLAAYTLVRLCGLDDVTAVSCLTDGKNDKGIDAIYFDHLNGRLLVVQSKFKQTSPSEQEAQKTINGIRALKARRFGELNESLQNRQQDLENALDKPGVKIDLIFVYLGDIFNTHATNDLNAYCVELNRYSVILNWQKYGGASVYQWTIDERSQVEISDTVVLEDWSGMALPRRAFYGLIRASEIARLVSTHKHALFSRNIRYYLGAVGINPAIEKTVAREPAELFYLNNGITITAERIESSSGNSFGLVNFSIVNGAQTAGTIAKVAESATIHTDAKLLATLIEVGPGTDATGKNITKARNSQNRINSIDFAALTPKQETLRQELEAIGITYYYRPSSEAQVIHDDSFKLEHAAVALACLALPIYSSTKTFRGTPPQNGLELVVTAKKEVGELWKQDGRIMKKIFLENLTGIRLCRLVHIYRFIDQILSGSEASNTDYESRMFYRHGRYFIMSLVAYALPRVINRVDPNLSDEDKTLLSQQVNKLSEQCYTASIPQQQYRGYLATFRNLTHSQQLADIVLQQLEQEAAAALLAATPPITPTP